MSERFSELTSAPMRRTILNVEIAVKKLMRIAILGGVRKLHGTRVESVTVLKNKKENHLRYNMYIQTVEIEPMNSPI